MTSAAAAELGVEARGKKAQYEHYFKNKTEGNLGTDDPEKQSCGSACRHVLERVISDPWKWLKSVPLSLMWGTFRLFVVASAVHSIVTCHLQWYVGDQAVEYTSVLETLVRLALVFNIAAGAGCWKQWRASFSIRKATWMDALVEGVKLVGQTLLQHVCAPATVLAALSVCAWVPANYFVGSKVRNWDWADDFVAASRLKPDQLTANIDT